MFAKIVSHTGEVIWELTLGFFLVRLECCTTNLRTLHEKKLRIGSLLSDPNSSFQIKVNYTFHL